METTHADYLLNLVDDFPDACVLDKRNTWHFKTSDKNNRVCAHLELLSAKENTAAFEGEYSVYRGNYGASNRYVYETSCGISFVMSKHVNKDVTSEAHKETIRRNDCDGECYICVSFMVKATHPSARFHLDERGLPIRVECPKFTCGFTAFVPVNKTMADAHLEVKQHIATCAEPLLCKEDVGHLWAIGVLPKPAVLQEYANSYDEEQVRMKAEEDQQKKSQVAGLMVT